MATCDPREFSDSEIFPGKTGYFRAQAEPDQVHSGQQKSSRHEIFDELRQVPGGHSGVQHRVTVPRERAHGTPIDDDDVHTAAEQIRCEHIINNHCRSVVVVRSEKKKRTNENLKKNVIDPQKKWVIGTLDFVSGTTRS